MNKKNPLFTSCDHKEDCTCDNVFNELTPINPAQARQKLDCLTRYREALERILDEFKGIREGDLQKAVVNVIRIAKQALKEESERL